MKSLPAPIRTLFIPAAVLASAMVFPAAHAQSVDPMAGFPNINAGAIHSHYMNQQFMMTNQPWLNRPVTKKDYAPREDEEPVIQFLNVDVEGTIVTPGGGAQNPAANTDEPAVSTSGKTIRINKAIH
ncbi:MAG: hypothetical protein AB7P76_04015 [Candidatus Melainabacteria bacterium]